MCSSGLKILVIVQTAGPMFKDISIMESSIRFSKNNLCIKMKMKMKTTIRMIRTMTMMITKMRKRKRLKNLKIKVKIKINRIILMILISNNPKIAIKVFTQKNSIIFALTAK